MTPEEVLFLQLPLPATRLGEAGTVEPLSAAVLYLCARRSAPAALMPRDLVDRAGDAALVRALACEAPDWIGFTTTAWNVERTLYVAGKVRERLPATAIFLGGPEVAADNPLIAAAGSIAAAFPGEGEPVIAELLAGRPPAEFADAIVPGSAGPRGAFRPPPVVDLDALEDPYQAGALALGPGRRLLLETARGCRYRCKFCSYGMRRSSSAFLSNDRIAAAFSWARERAVSEIYLLDPSLDQRPELDAFLEFLAATNRDPAIPVTGELRADRVTRRTAELLAAAGFADVEVGLQTGTEAALRILRRAGSHEDALRGAKLLREAGVRVRLDLVLGLPGEIEESWRATVARVADGEAWDEIQLFLLSVLPGTAFRAEAAELGLSYAPYPPYHVQATRDLSGEALRALYEETVDRLEVSLEPDLRPSLDDPGEGGSRLCPAGAGDLIAQFVVDLDGGEPFDEEAFDRATNAACLWFRGRDIWAARERMERLVRAFLARNPFAALAVVLEPRVLFPMDLLRGLASARSREHPSYLAAFYGFDVARDPDLRLLVVLPLAARRSVEDSWLSQARRWAEIVWCLRPRDAGAPVARLEADFPEEPDLVLIRGGGLAGEPAAIVRPFLALPDPERIAFAPRSLGRAWDLARGG